jgi:hypothetical protein
MTPEQQMLAIHISKKLANKEFNCKLSHFRDNIDTSIGFQIADFDFDTLLDLYSDLDCYETIKSQIVSDWVNISIPAWPDLVDKITKIPNSTNLKDIGDRVFTVNKKFEEMFQCKKLGNEYTDYAISNALEKITTPVGSVAGNLSFIATGLGSVVDPVVSDALSPPSPASSANLYPIVPASDRMVTFGDNSGVIINSVENLTINVNSQNEWKTTEDREIAQLGMSFLKRVVSSKFVQYSLLMAGISFLTWLKLTHPQHGIGEIADQLLTLLQAVAAK